MKKTIRIILMLLCVCTLLFSSTGLFREILEYRQGDEAYQALEGYVEMIPAGKNEKREEAAQKHQESGALEEEAFPENENESVATQWPSVDFAALREINSDLVGWLYSADTPIHYPVVQGRDNEYYLHHRFDKAEHKAGCIFMDASNHADLSDPHTVLYGHHMKNTSMFGTLTNYKKQEYYRNHPDILFLTPEKNYVIRLFAGYVSPGDGDAWRMDFSDGEDRRAWVANAVENSTFHSGIVPSDEDRIITLSTCSYEYDDARYVLLGILEPAE